MAPRLDAIENTLRIDERVAAIEAALVARAEARSSPPWWRDAKTVTILGGFLAAVIPLMTAIDGWLKNVRDAQHAVIEQQDKIRQTYLDRVLKPGITEIEQQRIFRLLSRLKSDPELQAWAQAEFETASRKVDDLEHEKTALEKQLADLRDQLAQARSGAGTATPGARPAAAARVESLAGAVARAESRAADIRERLGEPAPMPAGGSRCECPAPVGGGATCEAGQVAVCAVRNNACDARCVAAPAR